MILRTPPPSKRPRGGGDADGDGNGQLVIYEDPPESSQEPSASEHMLCTYQCRQMVCLIFSLSRQSTLSRKKSIITCSCYLDCFM